MSATRNPYYQLPGGAGLPGDVRVSDTADSTKTAADGWAASPAAVASAAATLSHLVHRLSTGNNNTSFKYKSVDYALRSTFILISTNQSSGICFNSLVVHIDDGSHASTELGANGLSISKIDISKSSDIYTVNITYDRYGVWGELFVIPSRDVMFIDQ